MTSFCFAIDYPFVLAPQMKSTAADLMKMVYYVTGPGADQAPVGLFKVHRYSGMLSVTDKLDREETKEYIVSHLSCSQNLFRQ